MSTTLNRPEPIACFFLSPRVDESASQQNGGGGAWHSSDEEDDLDEGGRSGGGGGGGLSMADAMDWQAKNKPAVEGETYGSFRNKKK